jgi:NADP-dependent aldehyde dehydrogenase
MSELQGMHFIAGSAEAVGGEVFHGVDPVAGNNLEPSYAEATPTQVARACDGAAAAAPLFAATAPSKRAALLRAIADGLMGLGDDLVKRMHAETALPAARVQGERARTVMQLQQFAALLDDGSWVDAHIDHGDSTRAPMPKPDLRRMLIPLGPVAVFGASNFPLAYSVAGGDTASALAAGCPVVVKGHPAHPGTSEMVGRVIFDAVQSLGLPAGTFSLLHGRSQETGGALVQNDAIKAVGFTGSHSGGRALFNQAADRHEPIPVFAEMGSANPLVVLPKALATRGSQIAEQVAASCLLAQGQFCTKPGLVLWLEGDGDQQFYDVLRERLCSAASGATVHSSIRKSYERAIDDVSALPVEIDRAAVSENLGVAEVIPALLRASPEAVLNNERLRSEIYGPAMLTVACRSMTELQKVVDSLDGHLTATVHGDEDDFATHRPVLDVLRRKVGRIIANGVPTGVEVSTAMVHGGPYPAATDARYSAVGTTSINRWVRPACWQDWPQDLLPAELRDGNPRGIQRLVNGNLES